MDREDLFESQKRVLNIEISSLSVLDCSVEVAILGSVESLLRFVPLHEAGSLPGEFAFLNQPTDFLSRQVEPISRDCQAIAVASSDVLCEHVQESVCVDSERHVHFFLAPA